MPRDRSILKALSDSGEQVQFDWARLQAQGDFLTDDKHQFTMFSGGFGTGKTTVLCAKLIWLLLAVPNNLGFVGRLDGKALRASTIQVLGEMLPREYIAKKNDQQGFMQLVPEVGGSKLIYGDFKDIGDLKNLPLGFFAIDQAEEIPKDVWEYLVGRLRRRVPVLHEGRKQYWVAGSCPNGGRHFALEGQLKCKVCEQSLPPFSEVSSQGADTPDWDMVIYRRYGFGACNPEGPSHWIFELFSGLPGKHSISEGIGDYCGYHATAWDGMRAGFTDSAYIREMEQLYKRNPLMWERYLEGKWVEAEGMVYPGWQREQSLLPSATKRWDGSPLFEEGASVFEWIDHGLTAPTAVGWVAIVECDCGCEQNDYFLVDEHYQGGFPVSYHSQAIKRHREKLDAFKVEATYLDSNAFSKTLMGQKGTPRENELYSIADEYMDHDIFPIPNQKDWDSGYNRITELLAADPGHTHPITGERGAPHFYCLTSCQNFVKEIEQYRWKKVRNVLLSHTEEPMDGNDHHMDAFNGFLTSRPGDVISIGKHFIEEDPAWLHELDEADQQRESHLAL